MYRVLVIDDDQRLLTTLSRTLGYAGFHVLTAPSGEKALATLQTESVDVAVLDWLMPGLDGIGLIKVLRAMDNETPILVLSARDAVENRVTALDAGADDYLVKPFAPTELVARIKALLRRSRDSQDHAFFCADLYLNPLSRTVMRGERRLSLTPTEFDLLLCLLRHVGRVLARQQLLQAVWGYDFDGDDNVLDVYIGYLRRKMEANGESRLIQTVRGVGFVMCEEPDDGH